MFTGVLFPLPPLVSPRFCFLREFFSRALPSERLEQAISILPQIPLVWPGVLPRGEADDM